MATGLIVRCDMGGLAAQTGALWQHLRPEHTLVVDLPEGQCRGDRDPGRFQAPWTRTEYCHTNVIPEQQLCGFAERVDTLLTVECLYAPPPTWRKVNERARTVLVANPELFTGSPAHQIIAPTTWELERLPNPLVLPHPVDIAPVEHRRRRREHARHFLHVEAPAMADRNGSLLVAAAIPHVKAPVTLTVRSWQSQAASRAFRRLRGQQGHVKVVWDCQRHRDWWDGYPDHADVLLLPRRYGGLSMVAQEAAAIGIPSLTLNVNPQQQENWPGWRTPTHPQGKTPMKGGHITTHTTNPKTLANHITALATGEIPVDPESLRALEWSEARSWESLGDRWREVCNTPR